MTATNGARTDSTPNVVRRNSATGSETEARVFVVPADDVEVPGEAIDWARPDVDWAHEDVDWAPDDLDGAREDVDGAPEDVDWVDNDVDWAPDDTEPTPDDIPESVALTPSETAVPVWQWRSTMRRALIAAALLVITSCVLQAVGIASSDLVLVAITAAVAVWCAAIALYCRSSGRAGSYRRMVGAMAVAAFVGGVLAAAVTDSWRGGLVGISVALTGVGLIAALLVGPGQAMAARDETADPAADEPAESATEAETVESSTAAEGSAAAGWIALFGFAVLAVLIPASMVASTSNESGTLWWWSMPIVLLTSWRLSWLIRRGERRLYEMTFWVFTYAFMGLAPMVQLREHSFPVTVARSDWTLVIQAALIVLLGCVAFLFGCFVATQTAPRAGSRRGRRRGNAPVPDAAQAIVTVSFQRLIMLSLFAIVFNLYYLSKIGWIQFTRSRVDAFADYDVIWRPGSLGILVRACTFMTLLVAWVAWMRYRREMSAAAELGMTFAPSRRWSSAVFAVVIGILLANTMNPISNARYLSGTAILAATVAFGLFATRARYRTMVLAFVIGLVVLFPMADAFRYSKQAEFKSTNPVDSLLSPDYDSFAQIANGILIANRDGVIPGRQMLGVLLWWFPRAMWPNKPEDTGIFIADARGYPFTNLSAPLWVEFFLSGGWVAVLLGMAVVGYVLYRLDTDIDRQMRMASMPTVVGAILPFYLLILLRGSLLQAMSYLMFIMLSAWFIRKIPEMPGGPMDRSWLPRSLRYRDPRRLDPHHDASPAAAQPDPLDAQPDPLDEHTTDRHMVTTGGRS